MPTYSRSYRGKKRPLLNPRLSLRAWAGSVPPAVAGGYAVGCAPTRYREVVLTVSKLRRQFRRQHCAIQIR